MVPNAALLFTDIVDSTSTTQRLGDERAAALWKEHDRRARDLLRQHNGREIGRSDGLLMLFEAAADAARYALQYHAQMEEMGLAARAGMHVGPVVLRESSDDDVALGAKRTEAEGLALPFASRVMAMARGGQTLLTAGAKEALDPAALGTAVRSAAMGTTVSKVLTSRSRSSSSVWRRSVASGHRPMATSRTGSCAAATCGGRCATYRTTCRPNPTRSLAAQLTWR